jgi:F-type H+-transporting ATPase subunit b
MIDINFTTIILEIINFLVLTALLFHFVFRPVIRRVEARNAEKERLQQEIRTEREETAQLKKETESLLANVHEEVNEIVNQAEARIDREQRELLRGAQEEADRILNEAQTQAQEMQEHALQEFHERLLDTIINISKRVLSKAAPQELHDTLFQQLNDRIWEMGRSDIRQVTRLRRSLGERTPVVYAESARDLSNEQRGKLISTFSALADRTVELETNVNPDLAAGVSVRIGDIIVDSSIAAQLTDLREEVGEMLERQTANEQ